MRSLSRSALVAALFAAGCSSSNGGPGPDGFPEVGVDSTVSDTKRDGTGDVPSIDSGTDAAHDTKLPIDTGSTTDAPLDSPSLDGPDPDTGDVSVADTTDAFDAPDASPAIVPIGAPCTTDSDCDPTGAHVGQCSNDLNPPDTTDPAPVCVANACTTGTGGAVARCGVGDVGVCVYGGAKNQCFPACTFDSTTSPTGCRGLDGCNYFGWETTSGGAVRGVGYCSGGCLADSDCTAGQFCQNEDGICVQTLTTYTKPVGATCTGGECPCIINATTLTGFCSSFCITGSAVASCPTGFSCDPGVPATDPTAGTLFTAMPPGVVGICEKNCTTDADCTSLSAYCSSNEAIGQKVCRIGPKPP